MDQLLLPILIAVAVGCAAWSLANVLGGAGRGEKKRLQQRLSTENRSDVAALVASKPIFIQLEVKGLPERLAGTEFVQRLHRKLMAVWPRVSVVRFFAIVGISALGLFGAVLLVTASAVPAATSAAFGLYLPFFLLDRKRGRQQRQIADQLPEALDFLARVLRAGHSLTTGLQMISDEMPQPLAGEFRRAYDQHSLGQSLDDVLKDMATRVESTDFAFFVTAVLIQRQTGGDLSEVLTNISGMIRGRIRLQQHVKAKTAEGRFTGYILVAFPAVMFVLAYLANPDYAGVLVNTSTGKWLLGIAATLQVLGLIAIRKLTTVRV
jgi:tight adherence protein B